MEFDAGSKFEPTPQRSLDRRGGARAGSHGRSTWLRDPQDRANFIERAPGGLQRLDLEQPVEVLRTVVASASDAQRHWQQPLLDVVPDGTPRDVTEVGQLLNGVVLCVRHILNIHSQLSHYNCYIIIEVVGRSAFGVVQKARMGDFTACHAGGTYADGSRAKGVTNIFFDENHTVVSASAKISGDVAEVDVVVAWQASLFDLPSAKSKRVSLDATQKCTV